MKIHTFREQFEMLDDMDCFMATFYTLDQDVDIDSKPRRNALWDGFNFYNTIEGLDYWSDVFDSLDRLLESQADSLFSIQGKCQLVSCEGDFYKPLSTFLEFAHRDDALICNVRPHPEWNAFQIAPVRYDGEWYDVCDPEDATNYSVYTSMGGGEKNWVADFSSEIQAIDFVKVVSVLTKSYRP